MKARVKGTDVELEVHLVDKQARYIGNDGVTYWEEDLDFGAEDKDNPDYWTRLEHQYAGMAMQGMMNNSYLAGEFRKDPNNGIKDMSNIITKAAIVYAHALVEKMKEKEERK